MNDTVNFILESGFSLSLLSLIYVLFLRKETFFRLNRYFLLGSVFFSVTLPFLKLKVYDPQPVMLPEITVTPYRNMIEAVTIYGHGLSLSIEEIILSTNTYIIVYLAGVAFFLLRLLIRIGQIVFLIRKNGWKDFNGMRLVNISRQVSPFSFLNYIFIGEIPKEGEDYRRMILHEAEHIRQGHSFDVIILEILSVVQWFNPFMWLLKRAIRENHEYLADQGVLLSGVNYNQYKKLLLNQVLSGQFGIANNFNYSLIKNRLRMMSKIKSPKWANSKLILGIVVALGLVVAFACEKKDSIKVKPEPQKQDLTLIINGDSIKIEGSGENLGKVKTLLASGGYEITPDSAGLLHLSKKQVEAEKKMPESIPRKKSGILKTKTSNGSLANQENNESEETVFFIVEEMPEFPGGEQALRQFIANTIKYPQAAQEKGIQGKVYVTFVVSKDGSVKQARVARGVDPSLDREALRVVNNLPLWKPGKQRGKAVNVSYTVPINFVLK